MASPDPLAAWDFSLPWYHGSPLQLETLLPGSTITQDEALARVFSHKPQIVVLDDDRTLRHNGALPGLLYTIDEPLGPPDIYPHPRSSMPPGLEWLTRRPLRLRLLGPVPLDPTQLLTPQDIADLLSRMK